MANEVASGGNGCSRSLDLQALSVRFRCSASHKGGYRAGYQLRQAPSPSFAGITFSVSAFLS